VVGINTAIIRDSPLTGGAGMQNGYIQGISFALPITPVRRVLDQIATTGTVKRGYLGVSVGPVTSEAAKYNGLADARGAYVTRVDPDTPARDAGVRQDDIIVAVDGKEIGPSEDLVAAISARRPGDKVRLTLWREGTEVPVTVTLAERTVGTEQAESDRRSEPESGADDPEETATALGFSVGRLSDVARRRLESENRAVQGVYITEVDPASAAADRGVTEGQVLLELNGQPTPTVDAYRRAAAGVKPGQVVRLRVLDVRSADELSIYFTAPADRPSGRK
jgi:serine protease Do